MDIKSLAQLVDLPRIPPEDCAYIYRVAADVESQQLIELKRLLSDFERTKADRFRQAADHARSVVARANLRKILASMLNCTAERVAFQQGRFGKPELCSSLASNIQFNVSHSGRWVLIGITSLSPIGVDVEEIREFESIPSIVKSNFSLSECEQWQALPKSQRTVAFFRGWTCKEAVIKALGTGVSVPTDAVEVDLDPSQPPRIIHFGLANPSNANWRLEAHSPAPGYLAAVACDERVTKIHKITCSPS